MKGIHNGSRYIGCGCISMESPLPDDSLRLHTYVYEIIGGILLVIPLVIALLAKKM